MPPFTSTSWTTALRRVAASAKQAVVHSVKPRLTQRAINLARDKAIHSARQVLYETFPSLSSPTFIARQPPRFALQTIPLNPLQRASMTVRAHALRTSRQSPRGANMVSQVGLGSARSYSSTFNYTATSNAHILLRAFAGLDDSLPKSSWYDSYPTRKIRGKRTRRQRRVARVEHVDISQHNKPISALDHYFPFRSTTPSVDEPIMPEQLVTPGVTSTLSVALDPSLDDAMEALTNISYREAEIGISVMSHLLKGITSISEAYSWHASRRVIPLLAKLESYGVLEDRGDMTPQLWVERGSLGGTDILHIVFPSRSATDVRRLLGESVAEGDWFKLAEALPYTPSETDDMTERWDPAQRQSLDAARSTRASPIDGLSLAVSLAESSSASSFGEDSYHGMLDSVPTVHSSMYASSTLTPEASQAFFDRMEMAEDPDEDEVESLVFPRLDISCSTSCGADSVDSPARSPLAWSSASSDIDSIGSEGGSVVWSIAPSEDDDLDSVMSEMAWSEASSPISSRDSRPPSPAMTWSSGSGYGILQPW